MFFNICISNLSYFIGSHCCNLFYIYLMLSPAYGKEDFSHYTLFLKHLYGIKARFFSLILTMADSASSSSSLPLNTMVHMLTIKLTSSNYLLWKNQFVSHLASQDLFGYLDGSIEAPSTRILAANGTTKSNPAYTSWLHTDQTLLSLLYFLLLPRSL